MASSNHTTYFNLSQYSASDKPTYLVDYNGDMSKIDAGLHEADSDAKTAISEIGDLSNLTTTAKSSVVASINEVDAEADANTTAIGNLSNLTTTANTDLVVAINEVDAEADNNSSNIGTMANLETTVKTNLVGAINEVNSNFNKFNLTNFNSYTGNDMSYSSCSYNSGAVTVASNSDYSILKIYGNLVLTTSSGGWGSAVTISNAIPSGYRPSSDITINPCGSIVGNYSEIIFSSLSVTLKTTGEIVLNIAKGTNTDVAVNCCIIPFIIFTKDFGDTPTPTP